MLSGVWKRWVIALMSLVVAVLPAVAIVCASTCAEPANGPAAVPVPVLAARSSAQAVPPCHEAASSEAQADHQAPANAPGPDDCAPSGHAVGLTLAQSSAPWSPLTPPAVLPTLVAYAGVATHVGPSPHVVRANDTSHPSSLHRRYATRPAVPLLI